MKGQTNMILLLLVLLIFIGMVIMLISLSKTVVREEYSDLYANNMLLSLLRTSTGYNHPCETVSETVACAFLTPGYVCEGASDSPVSCSDLANETIRERMEKMPGNMRYYLSVRSKGGVEAFDEGNIIRLKYGDPSLERDRISKKVARTVIHKVRKGTEYSIEVVLMLSWSGK